MILPAQPDRITLSHQSAPSQALGGASSPDRLRTRGAVLRDVVGGTASQSVASSPNAAIQRQVEVAQRTMSSLSSILSKYRKVPSSPPPHQPSQDHQPQPRPGGITSEQSEGLYEEEPPVTSVDSPLESDEGAGSVALARGHEQSESAPEGRPGSAGPKAPAIVTVCSNSRPPAAYDLFVWICAIRRHHTTVSILEAAADLGAGGGTKSGGGGAGGGPGAVGLVRPSSPSLVRPLVLSDVLPPRRTL